MISQKQYLKLKKMMTLVLNINNGDLIKTNQWIYSPCPFFQNEIPIELICSGANQQVIDYLSETNRSKPIPIEYVNIIKNQSYILNKKYIIYAQDYEK